MLGENEELDELLNDPEKKPPASWESKRQSGQKETVTLANERQNMRSDVSTSTREVLNRMLQKTLTAPFTHFVELHMVFPAKDGKSGATDEDGSRQIRVVGKPGVTSIASAVPPQTQTGNPVSAN